MNKQQPIYDARQLICASLLGALAVILPFFFHLVVPQIAKLFLPLFIPIAVAGFLVEIRYSLALCFLVPVLSFATTGMPPLLIPPIGAIMILELMLLTSLNFIFYRKFGWNIFVAAFLSLLLNRLFYLAILFIVADLLNLPRMTFTLYAGIKQIPGFILLLTVVPVVTSRLQKIPFFTKMLDD